MISETVSTLSTHAELKETAPRIQVAQKAHEALFFIADKLQLENEEVAQLMGTSISEMEGFKRDPASLQSGERLRRIRCLVVTFKTLMKDLDEDYTKISRELRAMRKGPPFYHRSPLQHMKDSMIGMAITCKFYTGKLPAREKRFQEFVIQRNRHFQGPGLLSGAAQS